MRRLSKQQKQILNYVLHDRFSPAEIAKRRGTSVQAVYKTIGKLKNRGLLKDDSVDPLTPLFPVERDRQVGAGSGVLEGDKLVSGELPKEHFSNSMTIGRKIVWRPNNYRRCLEVGGIKSPVETVRVLGDLPVEVTTGNHNKLVYAKMNDNIKVMIGRTKLVSIWSQNVIGGHKETFLVEARNDNELDDFLNLKKRDIRDRLDNALLSVARRLGVVVPYKSPFWLRHEDFLKGEEFVDSIPAEVVIHDSVFKKVYGEGVEFMGGSGKEPNVGYKNYIKNRALENFLPGLELELKELRGSNLEFASNLRLHLRVLEDIRDAVRVLRSP